MRLQNLDLTGYDRDTVDNPAQRLVRGPKERCWRFQKNIRECNDSLPRAAPALDVGCADELWQRESSEHAHLVD